ncbi:MAG: hypothetical protein ACFFCM_14175 [Promethearchaeota archaeon]
MKEEFEKIRTIIKFRDKNNKKRTIATNCNITIEHPYFKIIAREIIKLKEKGIYYKKTKNAEIDPFTEENIYKIMDIAKKYKINWPLIMDINFKLISMAPKKFQQRIGFGSPGSKNLILNVITPHDLIEIELEKKKANAWTPSQDLIAIHEYLSTHQK